MPSSKHFFHKNRSQASLLNTQDHHDRRPYQASPADSPLQSPAFAPHQPVPVSSSPHDDQEDYRYGYAQATHSEESRFYQLGLPTRSQSQRNSPGIYGHQPTIQLVGPPHGGESLTAAEENPDSYYQHASTPSTPRDDRKKRFFGLVSSSPKELPVNNGAGNSQRLGRSISVRKKAPPISTENTNRSTPNRWSTSIAPPTSEEEEEGGGAGLDLSHLQPLANSAAPPIPEKDPLRSPHFPPPPQDYPSRGASLQGVTTNNPVRQPLERQGSSNSSVWENTIRQQYRASADAPHHQPQSYQPSPSSATSVSTHSLLLSRGPADPPQQYYQEPPNRPSSQHSFGPPSPIQPTYRGSENHPYRASSSQSTPGAFGPNSMGPPASQQQPQGRHSNELPHPNQLSREGSGYQSYAQNAGPNQGPGAPPQYSGQLGVNAQGGTYRGPPQTSPMVPQASTDTGRSTPPPSRSRDDLGVTDIQQAANRYEELRKFHSFSRSFLRGGFPCPI